MVLDPVGGPGTAASWRSLLDGGRLVAYGFLGSVSPRRDLLALRVRSMASRRRTARFYRLSTAVRRDPDRFRELLRSLPAGGLTRT